MIGKPVLKKQVGIKHGTWLRDFTPTPGSADTRIWVTYDSKGVLLYEYASEKSLSDNTTYNSIYDLGRMGFSGTGHVVYNNSLYYQLSDTWKIVRYDLSSRTTAAVNSLHRTDATLVHSERLYRNVTGIADFAVDQTGLWVIYANHRDNTAAGRFVPHFRLGGSSHVTNDNDVFFLAKLDLVTLEVLKTFTLILPLSERGNAFLVCGALYMVKETTAARTNMYAFDAYTYATFNLSIAFINPFSNNAQLTYDPRRNEILGWDSGNLISYPLLLKPSAL